MRIDFTKITETVIPHMRGGEKAVSARMFLDPLGKIMRGKLPPGATIGLHTHETSSEVLYILAGTGKALCDGVYEPLAPGDCHVCPVGHTHSLMNDGETDLEFFAVVPEQPTVPERSEHQ